MIKTIKFIGENILVIWAWTAVALFAIAVIAPVANASSSAAMSKYHASQCYNALANNLLADNQMIYDSGSDYSVSTRYSYWPLKKEFKDFKWHENYIVPMRVHYVSDLPNSIYNITLKFTRIAPWGEHTEVKHTCYFDRKSQMIAYD